MFTLDREKVGILGCQIMNVVMEVGEVLEGDVEHETSLQVDFNLLMQEGEDIPMGIDVLAYLRIDEGSVYSLDMTGRVFFDIPDDFSAQDAEDYLSMFGATRAFDCLHPHMLYLANGAGFTGLDIPPIIAEIS